MSKVGKNEKVEWNLAENPYGYVREQHVFTLGKDGRSYVIVADFEVLTVHGKFRTAEDAMTAAQDRVSQVIRAGISWPTEGRGW